METTPGKSGHIALLKPALALALTMAILGTQGNAQTSSTSAVTWRTWSDTTRVTDADARVTLERAFSALQRPFRGGAAATEAGKMETEISMLEAELASLSPSDPDYAGVKRELEELRLASAVLNRVQDSTARRFQPAANGVTFHAALQGAQRFVNAYADATTQATWMNALKGKNAREATEFAVAATLQGNDVAAVTALLEAQRLQSKGAEPLVNLAAVLARLGVSYEALALLDEAAKRGPGEAELGLDAQAALLNNRGYVLLTLKRYAEAETLLRKATSLDPHLAEARRNLALALRGQGKAEALRFIRAGLRRSPPVAQATGDATGKTPKPTNDPAHDPDREDVPAGEHVAPAEQVFDLSRGVNGTLPTLPYPENAADGLEFAQKMLSLREWYTQRQLQRLTRIQILTTQAHATSSSAALTEGQLDAIHQRIDAFGRDPALQRHWRVVQENLQRHDGEVTFTAPSLIESDGVTPATFNQRTTSGRWNQKLEDAHQQMIRDAAACFGRSECTRAAQQVMHQRICQASLAAHAEWRTSMLRLDGAVSEAFDPTYRVLTGLIGNIANPVQYELARLWLEQRVDGVILSYLIGPAASPVGLWQMVQAVGTDGVSCGQLKGVADIAAASLQDPGPCTTNAAYKVKFDLAKVLALSFSCTAMSVEFAAPEGLVRPMTEIEFAYKGQITVLLGAKAGLKAGPLNIGPGVKGGAYVTFDTSGNFVDAGLKGSLTGNAGISPVGGALSSGAKISFISG